MTRKLRGLVAMLFALGTIGMGASSASAAGTGQIPFKGSYSGTTAFTSATTATLSGTGISTYLGRGTNVGDVVILATNGPCPGGLQNGIVNDNFETLTAANGDKLTFLSHDDACPIGDNQAHSTGHWDVTGGTGRFSGASGHGTLDAHVDFNQGTYSFQLTGTVSIPNGG